MKNIWQNLKKPIFILAPMDDVTDTVFRQIIDDLAAPDLYFTEFTSVDGIVSEKGSEAVTQRLKFTEKERPIIAQVWGSDPKKYFKASQMTAKMGFDGIDINMGCPVKDVVKRGMCSALINNPKLAAEIIQAVKDGAPELPISVKTRIGFRAIQTEEWLGFLLQQNLDALIVHGRTAREMSKVPAHWDEIGKVVKLRDQINPKTTIIGNGDIESYKQGLQMVKLYGLDGIMIGRGVFKNLWIFDKSGIIHNPPLEERLQQLLKHTKLFLDIWGDKQSLLRRDKKTFSTLKKFYKCYISDFEGAGQMRAEFMKANSLEDVEKLVKQIIGNPLPGA